MTGYGMEAEFQLLSSSLAQPPALIREAWRRPYTTLDYGSGGVGVETLISRFGSGAQPLLKRPSTETLFLTTSQMLAVVLESGISIGKLAEMVNATRPTIYNWRDNGVEATQEDHHDKLQMLHQAVSLIPSPLRPFLGKVFLRDTHATPSLYQLMIDGEKNQLNNWAKAVQPVLAHLSKQPQRRRMPELNDETELPIVEGWDSMSSVGQERHPG